MTSFSEEALSSSYLYMTPPVESNTKSTNWWKKAARLIIPWTKVTEETELGEIAEPEPDDNDVVREIMELFRENNYKKMEMFLEGHVREQKPSEGILISLQDEFEILNEYIDDNDMNVAQSCMVKPRTNPLLSRIRKSVRFEMDITPETNQKAFKPMFTSTPLSRNEDEINSDTDECNGPMPLCPSDSNTVLPPKEFSSIMKNESFLPSFNKIKEEALASALDSLKWRSGYRIYYDDTDEEEVLDDEPSTKEECAEASSNFSTFGRSHQIAKTYVVYKSPEDEVNSNISGIDRIEEFLKWIEEVSVSGDNQYGPYIEKLYQNILQMRKMYRSLENEAGNVEAPLSKNRSVFFEHSLWAEGISGFENNFNSISAEQSDDESHSTDLVSNENSSFNSAELISMRESSMISVVAVKKSDMTYSSIESDY